MRFTFLLCFIIGLVFQTRAVPYHGHVQQFLQPDGRKVPVKLYGTEYYIRAESPAGYTLIRDRSSGWICYAEISKDGNSLVSTGQHYTDPMAKPDISSIRPHADISAPARKEIIRKNRSQLSHGRDKGDEIGVGTGNHISGTPIVPVSGQVKGLCIVVDFSDEPAVVPASEFTAFCNDMNYSGYGNNGSLRKFYHDISGGILDYHNVVYGYYRAPLTFAQYDAMPYAEGAQQILGLALDWIKAQGFDFSTLTINEDNSITAINLMYTGTPPNWAEGMWHHKGYFNGFSANGVQSGDYNCSPANAPLELAVVAHENGHMIGKWPDTYKYNSDTGPDGIGSFDLMCWYGNSQNPTVPNPLFRSNAGWGKVVDISHYNGLISDTANSGTCYKYTNLNDTSEFFLMENRTKTGRSEFIESEGLTIWHLDRKGDNQTTHHEVRLVHAGNNIENHATACFRQGFKTEYSNTTNPKSLFYNGDESGLRVWGIGPKGGVMTYKIGLGAPGPQLKLLYKGIVQDGNENQFLEAGESGALAVSVKNFGQLESGIVKVKLSKVSPNAQYINILTDSASISALPVLSAGDASFPVSIAANAPLGTEVTVRFVATDGQQTISITRKITIGIQALMANDTTALCSGIFTDEGGNTGNYSNLTDLVKVLLPSSSGQKLKVQFIDFEVENEISCGYDYLEIYDGPSTGHPIIGAFCGTDSPGNLTATDVSGALTFLFHSDDGVTAQGWRAIVSCEEILSNQALTNAGTLQLRYNQESRTIEIENAGTGGKILVSDMVGRMVYGQNLEPGQLQKISRCNWKPGVYRISLETTDGVKYGNLLWME